MGLNPRVARAGRSGRGRRATPPLATVPGAYSRRAVCVVAPGNRGRPQRSAPWAFYGFVSTERRGGLVLRPRPARQRGESRARRMERSDGIERRSAGGERATAKREERARPHCPAWFHRAGIERPQGASAQRDGQTGRAAATRAEERNSPRGEIATTCGTTDRPSHRV